MNAPDPLHILVVDDMPEIRRILGLYLTRTLHARVTEAASGLDGIQRFLEREPHLVFCDLTMPEMTGLEFLGFITRQCSAPDLPIIVLTTEDDETTKAQAAGFAIRSYLLKPFNPATILHALQGVVPDQYFRPRAA